MSAPTSIHRNIDALLASLDSTARVFASEMKELRATVEVQQRRATKIRESARAVVAARNSDDAAFRIAVTVLVTNVLGPGAFDAATTTEESSTLPVRERFVDAAAKDARTDHAAKMEGRP